MASRTYEIVYAPEGFLRKSGLPTIKKLHGAVEDFINWYSSAVVQISLQRLVEFGNENVGVSPGPVLTLHVTLKSVDESQPEASDEAVKVVAGQFEAFLLGRLRTEPVTMEKYRVVDDVHPLIPRPSWD
jgi:hypothetical protein